MNDETYSECIVSAKRPVWVIPAVIGAILFGAGFIYFLLCMNFWLELLCVVIAVVLVFLLIRYSSVEYEYLYLLDELTIAKIFRKSSRKDVLVVSMQDVEMICPTEDSDAERMRGSGSHSSSSEPSAPSGLSAGRPTRSNTSPEERPVSYALSPTRKC